MSSNRYNKPCAAVARLSSFARHWADAPAGGWVNISHSSLKLAFDVASLYLRDAAGAKQQPVSRVSRPLLAALERMQPSDPTIRFMEHVSAQIKNRESQLAALYNDYHKTKQITSAEILLDGARR